MRIGVGITLITVGAIIAFAVRDNSEVFNLTALGICIMLAGAAGMWTSYRMANARLRDKSGGVIDPSVEKQYNTAPQKLVVDHPIDVTPSHLREPDPDSPTRPKPTDAPGTPTL